MSRLILRALAGGACLLFLAASLRAQTSATATIGDFWADAMYVLFLDAPHPVKLAGAMAIFQQEVGTVFGCATPEAGGVVA